MKIDFVSDINKDNYQTLSYDKLDHFFIKVLWWHFFGISLFSLVIYFIKPAAIYPSPYSWRVIPISGILWVLVLGFLSAMSMTLLRGKVKNHYVYRFLMTNALLLFSYLLVYVSGGSIETHFHFFIIMGALVIYNDWRLNWWAIVAVAMHHGLLNFIAPHWIYFYGRNDIAFTAHALLVLIMAILTTKICENGRKTIETIRLANVSLEGDVKKISIHEKGLEEKVAERTAELQDKVKELESFNKLAMGRELKMVELKKENEELRGKMAKIEGKSGS